MLRPALVDQPQLEQLLEWLEELQALGDCVELDVFVLLLALADLFRVHCVAILDEAAVLLYL